MEAIAKMEVARIHIKNLEFRDEYMTFFTLDALVSSEIQMAPKVD